MAQENTAPGKPRVGFIGLGLMGSRMAARLLAAGHPLAVFNRTSDRALPLAERGASIARGPGRLAASSDFVCSCLSDDAAVEAVLAGPEGAIRAARPGTAFIESSSISPETSSRLAAEAEGRGCSFIDAPVLGTGIHAERGELTFLVGGRAEAVERCRPILEVMGNRVFHMGSAGAGLTMKLAANTLLGIGGQAIAEALALGLKAGLDRNQMIDVLSQASMVSPAHRAKLESARRNDFSDVSLRLPLLHKDLRLALQLAARHSVPMPAASAAHQMYSAELARGAEEEDYSAIIRLMQQLAGL